MAAIGLKLLRPLRRIGTSGFPRYGVILLAIAQLTANYDGWDGWWSASGTTKFYIKRMPACLELSLFTGKEKERANMTRIVAVDFFCGAGGMTNGLIRAGIHVLGGVDNEPLCEKTYRQNRNRDGSRPEFICEDIFPKTKLYPQGGRRLIIERIEALISDYKRKTGYRSLRLVFAICAPCQPFTKITKIEMSEHRQFRRENDSNLLLTTTAIISHFKPAAIICENVEGIIEGPVSVLSIFKRRLARINYSFDAKIINAADFGIPQNRKRTIGIGFNKAVSDCDFEVLSADKKLKNFISVRESIGMLPSLAAGEVDSKIPNHRARALSPINLKRISCAKPGQSNGYMRHTPYGNLSLNCHKKLEKKFGRSSFGDTYTRMRGDQVSPTITTKFISITNGRFGHFDVKQNRALTPREAALLQTFPKQYVFFPEENLEFTATLIGNAVPPKLARFFGSYVRKQLELTIRH